MWSQDRGRKLVRDHASDAALNLLIQSRQLDRIKVRRAMESSLQKTAMKIVNIVNKDKDHIPPITTSEANPFPYRIVVNPKEQHPREERFGGAKAYERGGYGGWG